MWWWIFLEVIHFTFTACQSSAFQSFSHRDPNLLLKIYRGSLGFTRQKIILKGQKYFNDECFICFDNECSCINIMNGLKALDFWHDPPRIWFGAHSLRNAVLIVNFKSIFIGRLGNPCRPSLRHAHEIRAFIEPSGFLKSFTPHNDINNSTTTELGWR